MIHELIEKYDAGAMTAHHLAVQCLHMLDPAQPELVLAHLPDDVLAMPPTMRNNFSMDVTHVIAEMLSRNRGLDPLDADNRIAPDYGIVATLDGNNLDVKLTFRARSHYCCMEWGCHLALHGGKRWESLRRQFADHAVKVPTQLHLRLSCVVESGALFFDICQPDSTRRGWYAFAPAAAYEYQVSTTEAAQLTRE